MRKKERVESPTADSDRQLEVEPSSSSYVLRMEQELIKSADKRPGGLPLTWSPSRGPLPRQPRPDPEPPPTRGPQPSRNGRVVIPVLDPPSGSMQPSWRRSGATHMKSAGELVAGLLDTVGLARLGQALGACVANCCCLCPQPRAELEEFVSNEVTTAKYSLISFLPLNLFEQFQRVANLYFLVVVILMLIPGLAVVSSVTTVIPLLFVLTINAVKEAVDDVGRHKSDAFLNGQKASQLVRGSAAAGKDDTAEIEWRQVQVGHVLQVNMNEKIPADMILLQSSDPDNLCYLETANLDGETNLKLKYCYPATSKSADVMMDLKAFHIECEHPNPSLYTYEGAVVYSGGTRDPLTSDQLLLRGCTLRNAQWVIGIVVFTGPDTKIMLNGVASPRKVSRLERAMNHMVICMFAFQLLISALCALGTVMWARLHPPEQIWYIRGSDPNWAEYSVSNFFLYWIRYALLLNQMIPISLYVTLELVKVAQCMLLYNNDLEMYHEDTDTPFSSRTTTLNEELGQVKYVLSDKTGTLTQNVMGFVTASISGELYGINTPKQPPVPQFLPFQPHTLAWDMKLRKKLGEADLVTSPTALPRDLSEKFTSRQERERQRALKELDEFMLGLAVCNTVVPTYDALNEYLYYQAASPDEEALVQGAAYLGYTLLARTKVEAEVKVTAPNSPRFGKECKFKVLAILEFDSDRKRMSIIVRELCRDPESELESESAPATPSGRIRLYCKGADSIIAARLLQEPSVRGGANSELHRKTQEHLNEMAKGGFRTLSFAHRDLSEAEFQAWYAKYQEAAVAPTGRDQKIAAVSEEIERNLLLDGATGVEDKLQDRVPQAIEELGKAGIKVWVLTGDKLETAISIAHTCRLFNPAMHLETVTLQDLKLQPVEFVASRTQEVAERVALGVRVGLVIDGSALNVLLQEQYEAAFLALCLQVHSVVCCRVSPMQKADITRLVRDKAGAVTLAIGDGANDVSMIKAAHVGCGISGREGRAAVLAADYSFAQFQYLVRLLLVHGRSAYKRNSLTVLYCFYKNFMYCLPFVLASIFTGFSCLPVYPDAMLTTYNAVWTALPIVAYAVFEQDMDLAYVAKHPELYRETMEETRGKFALRLLGWLVLGTYHALVAVVVPLYTMANAQNQYGVHYSWYDMGTTIFTSVLLIANLKVATKTHFWTRYNCWAMGITLALWLPFLLTLGSLFPTFTNVFFSELAGVWDLLAAPHFWLVGVLLVPLTALLLDVAVDVARGKVGRKLTTQTSWHDVYTFARGRLRNMYNPLDGTGEKTISEWAPTITGASTGLGSGMSALHTQSMSYPVTEVMVSTELTSATLAELQRIEEAEHQILLQKDAPSTPQRPRMGWSGCAAVLKLQARTPGLKVDHSTLTQAGTKPQLLSRSVTSLPSRELMPLEPHEALTMHSAGRDSLHTR